MNSLYNFIIKPLHNRYNNKKKLEGGEELILNSNIEIFQSVEKRAVVVSKPSAINTPINVGDEIYIHHNIFRRYYDIRGNEKNSGSFFKDNLFFCEPHQIYLYKQNNKFICNLDYCFVQPVISNDIFSVEKEKPLVGIVKYTNKYLEQKDINCGDLVIFTPNSEFEFKINDQLLYCMKSKDIAIKNERYKEDEIIYNPSWA